MKRWAALLFLSLLVGVPGVVIQHARSEYEKKQREAEYQSILRRYSEALKPGITRKGVEAYLAAHQAKFSRSLLTTPTHTRTSQKSAKAMDTGIAAGKTSMSRFNLLLIRCEVACQALYHRTR